MSNIAGNAFRFLLQEGNQPFRSSRCYIEADPKIQKREQWVLQLDRPEGAPWVFEIDDIKAWMLHGKTVRQIIYDRSDPKTPFRDLERDAIFREYLRHLFERIPAEYQGRRKYALMPSISNDESRTRCREAVEAAIPEITVLPEPEMVAEYFRLLERSLELEPGRNNVVLVVDTGASTANMMLIVTRRDHTIVDVDATGAQRDLRLRALRGDSAGVPVAGFVTALHRSLEHGQPSLTYNLKTVPWALTAGTFAASGASIGSLIFFADEQVVTKD